MPELARVQRFRILPVARDFSASGAYCQYSGQRAVTNAAIDNSGDWTLMVWAITTSTGQQTPVSQNGSGQECAFYLDGGQTISVLSALSPGYHFNGGSAATFKTNTWECFLAAGTSNGWASYTRSSHAYVFNSTGNQRVSPSGTGNIFVGLHGGFEKQWQGRIGLAAIWAAFLGEREAKALGSGVAPWKIRRSQLRFLWAPRTRAGPDIDIIGNRYGTLAGSPTLAPFPARGIIRP